MGMRVHDFTSLTVVRVPVAWTGVFFYQIEHLMNCGGLPTQLLPSISLLWSERRKEEPSVGKKALGGEGSPPQRRCSALLTAGSGAVGTSLCRLFDGGEPAGGRGEGQGG